MGGCGEEKIRPTKSHIRTTKQSLQSEETFSIKLNVQWSPPLKSYGSFPRSTDASNFIRLMTSSKILFL